MSRGYARVKGRGGGSAHLGLPKSVIGHSNFCLLSPHANKLLIDLGEQYYGYNNGDLSATWVFMEKRGWKSRDTLNDALRELEHFGLITQTQEGGLNKTSLYALTWNKIDKAPKGSKWKVGDIPGLWRDLKKPFIKPSAKRRQKKQLRQACQSDTYSGTVSRKLRVIR